MTPIPGGVTLYIGRDTRTEFPQEATLPLNLLRELLHEFMRTGTCPTCVGWQQTDIFYRQRGPTRPLTAVRDRLGLVHRTRTSAAATAAEKSPGRSTQSGHRDLEHNPDNISCGATACSRFAPDRPSQSTVDAKARSPAACITAGQRAIVWFYSIVDLSTQHENSVVAAQGPELLIRAVGSRGSNQMRFAGGGGFTASPGETATPILSPVAADQVCPGLPTLAVGRPAPAASPAARS